MNAKQLHDFYFEDLGWCGCGDPTAAFEYLKDALTAIDNGAAAKMEFFGIEMCGIIWTYLYMLDAHGLTEHGFNISGCWLTDKGEDVLKALCTYNLEKVLDFEEVPNLECDVHFLKGE
jgi:hypothetical protein